MESGTGKRVAVGVGVMVGEMSVLVGSRVKVGGAAAVINDSAVGGVSIVSVGVGSGRVEITGTGVKVGSNTALALLETAAFLSAQPVRISRVINIRVRYCLVIALLA
jgi:hypothetical protein